MPGDNLPASLIDNCIPDLFPRSSGEINFRTTCAVCDEELSFDAQVARQLVCSGCKTAIKTFRAAIGS